MLNALKRMFGGPSEPDSNVVKNLKGLGFQEAGFDTETRCGKCRRERNPLMFWVPDSVRSSFTIKQAQREIVRHMWNGHHTAWCYDCVKHWHTPGYKLGKQEDGRYCLAGDDA
jgi:hypothetical protein